MNNEPIRAAITLPAAHDCHAQDVCDRVARLYPGIVVRVQTGDRRDALLTLNRDNPMLSASIAGIIRRTLAPR